MYSLKLKLIPLIACARGCVGWQIKFILHDFPLPYHTWSFTSHGAARVVEKVGGNESFWKYVDLLYDQQSAWNNQYVALPAP